MQVTTELLSVSTVYNLCNCLTIFKFAHILLRSKSDADNLLKTAHNPGIKNLTHFQI